MARALANPTPDPDRPPGRHRVPEAGGPVGLRQAQVEAMVAELQATPGWVTLTGMGGCGKTFVAALVTRHWSDAAHPVVWVDLQAARTAHDVDREVPSALGLGRGAGAAAVAHALHRLAHGLLVLDNVEQLPDTLAARIEGWCEAAPTLRVLVTSRRPLAGGLERVVPLDLLRVPSRACVLDSEAWDLFASWVAGPLQASAEEAHQLLTRLEGWPLAMKLAAGRLEVLDVPQLVERLDRRWALLADPDRTHDRQGSMRNALAWSWQLLSDAERLAMMQASVFRGPFDLEEASAVIDVPQLGVRDALAMLVRRHLVSQRGDGYRLLDSVRAFAAGQRSPEADRAVVARHAAWFSRAPTGERRAWGPTWLEAGLRRLPELIAGVERFEQGRLDAPAAYACALQGAYVLFVQGRQAQAMALADRVLSAPLPAQASVGWELQRLRAESCRMTGQIREARAALERIIDRAAAAGHPNVAAHARVNLSFALVQCDERDASEVMMREAVDQLRAVGDLDNAVTSEAYLATLIAERLDFPEAGSGRMEIDAMMERALGDLPGLSAPCQLEVLKHAGWLRLELGQLAASAAAYAEAATVAASLRDERALGAIRGQQGLIAESQGKLADAVANYDHAIGAFEGAGQRLMAAYYLGFRGRVGLRRGAWPAAERDLRASLALRGDVGQSALFAKIEAVLAFGEARWGSGAITPWSRPRGPLTQQVTWFAAAVRAWRSGDEDAAKLALVVVRQRLPAFDSELTRDLVDALVTELELRLTEWRFAMNGGWFRAPGEAPVDLSRRPGNARVLAALVRRRERQPGEGASVQVLFDAGWPDQRALDTAAANRVRVALSTLRRSGLGNLLQRNDEGWLLDPDVPVAIEADAAG